MPQPINYIDIYGKTQQRDNKSGHTGEWGIWKMR